MTQTILPPPIHNKQPPVQSNRDKILTRLSFIVIGVAIAFLSTLAYWGFEDETVFEGQGDHIVFVDDKALAGQNTRVKLSYCKKIDEPIQFTRSFVAASTEISNPTLTDRTGKGCITNREVLVPVPSHIASGKYRLKYHITAQINPLKTVSEEYYSSDEIEIIGLVDQKIGE